MKKTEESIVSEIGSAVDSTLRKYLAGGHDQTIEPANEEPKVAIEAPKEVEAKPEVDKKTADSKKEEKPVE